MAPFLRKFGLLAVLPTCVLGLVASPYDKPGQRPLTAGPVSQIQGEALACPLAPILDGREDGLPSGRSVFTGINALEIQVRRHQAVVRVPTVCYDDLGDLDSDERWLPFYRLHEVLEKTYPAVHRRAQMTKVNTLGLVYTLAGSDLSLKPALLAAHQDVVPVGDDTLSWTYPPFNATFDGEWLWGRGAADDKSSLTAILSAVEALASNSDWTPRRTIVLAFGFDEECSGYRGAGAIGRHLLDIYGKDGFVLILDEGSTGIEPLENGRQYALVGVQEKGHVDITFSLSVRGGHSSVPLPHTGIGIMAEIVTALEAHAYEPELSVDSPTYQHLACQLRYSPDSEPELFELLKSGKLEKLATELAKRDPISRFRLTTSVAVTTVRGGQKINALPEVVTLGVNFRPAPQDSIVKVQHDVVKHIRHVVDKYGLDVVAYKGDEEYEEYASQSSGTSSDEVGVAYEVDYNGTLTLRASEKFPATPSTPTSGEAWDIFAGTIRHSLTAEDNLVVPVGELMIGNTDTRHYLDLSQNIYRWLPVFPDDMLDYHAVDERVRMEANLRMAAFYYDLIRNLCIAD